MITQTLNSGREIKYSPYFSAVPLKIRDKWIDALRSGQYKQGHRVLRSAGDNYCCLGVLCEVERLTCKLVRNYFYDFAGHVSDINYLGYSNIDASGKLPTAVSYIDGSTETQSSALADLNDEGFTFDEIAEIISIFFYQTN